MNGPDAGRREVGPVPVPWRTVGAIAGSAVVLLLLLARRYGWHRDELYFLEAGRHHLDWGYVDQPPFTPFVARLAHGLAPGNLVVLRIAPALTTAATIVLGALIARELGGSRRAQVWAAAGVAAGGFTLGVGHLLSTAAFDLTAWMALLWLATRLLRTAEPRWWVVYGAVAGVALLNKHLVVLLTITLLAALVVERRWELLASRWVLVGGVAAAIVASPNLIWQAQHGWPQLDMAEALSERLATENRATLLPLQLVFAGPLLVGALWTGARELARAEAARPYRALLWAWPIGLGVVFATGGRPYYAVPLTIVVLIVGLVEHIDRRRTRWLPWLVVANGAVSAGLGLPVLPTSNVETSASLNETVAEQIGWPELVEQVAAVVRSLPVDEREDVVLLTLTYGEAAAIDRFGPALGLPGAYSGHNAYADFGRPTDPGATVVAVRFPAGRLDPLFERCDVADRVDNGLDVDNEVQGTPITVCRGLRGTWDQAWEDLRFLS